MTKPLAIDLFCGLGGWTEGLLSEGYDVVGFDIEKHEYGDERYPGKLVIQDVLSLHGSQFKDAALIVASPPCQAYSYMAMPWSLAKAKAERIRADETGAELEQLNALFNACFRIQRECNEDRAARGLPPVPMVVENVKGAQPWVGRAAWNFGSYYIWGNVPALMPNAIKAQKFNPDGTSHGTGSWFAIADSQNRGASEGQKVPGFRFDGSGRRFQTASVNESIKNNGGSWFNIGSPGQKETNRNPVHALAAEGRKAPSGTQWFNDGPRTPESLASMGSKSSARKAASAKIAKIPFALSSHIARVWRP